jgi:hypothetical protein
MQEEENGGKLARTFVPKARAGVMPGALCPVALVFFPRLRKA